MSTPLFRIEDRARPSPSLARFALGPVSLVTACALFYGGFVSQLAAMCIAGAGLISFSAAELFAGMSRDAYDRAALALMATGKTSALRARLHAAWPFRIFGTGGERAAREGAVLAAEGKKEEAAKAWARAVAGYPGGVVPLAVAVGFAGAAFDAGWDRDAMRAYRALFERDPEMPRVRVRLAHALAKLGEDREEADALLAAAESAKADAADVAAAREALRGATKTKKQKRS